MRTQDARLSRMAPTDAPAKPRLPQQPADGANWHDWLTLGVFILSVCTFVMGIAAVITSLSQLESQGLEIKTLKANLEQLSNQEPLPLAQSLRQHRAQTMQDFENLLVQRLKELPPTADPRLNKLADLQTQLQHVDRQLESIEKAIQDLSPPAPPPTAPSPPAPSPTAPSATAPSRSSTEPAAAEVPLSAPAPPSQRQQQPPAR